MAFLHANAKISIPAHDNWSKIPRPHETIPGFMEWRKSCIERVFPEVHPLEDVINGWTMTREMVNTRKLKEPREIKYVSCEPDLIECALDLEINDELMIDVGVNEEGYLALIWSIHISTPSTDYVVHTLPLFSKIQQHLGPIFENSEKLKVFHNQEALLHLQSNFEIFTVGIVAVQEAYEQIKGKENVSFKYIVEDILGIQLSEVNSIVNWQNVPLSKELITCAAGRNKYLFLCWLYLKNEAVSIESEPFPRSKDACLQLVSNSYSQTAEKHWLNYMQLLKLKCMDRYNIFNISAQRECYFNLFNWRENLGRVLDYLPHNILPDKKMEFITRAMPSSINSLLPMIVPGRLLGEEHLKEILAIIKPFKESIMQDSSQGIIDSNQNRIPQDNVSPADAHDNKVEPVVKNLPSSKVALKHKRYRKNLKAKRLQQPIRVEKPFSESTLQMCLLTAVKNKLTVPQLLNLMNKIPKDT